MAPEQRNPTLDQPAAASNRRALGRVEVCSLGVVFCGDSDRSFDCTIRNISTGGARIVLADGVELPQQIRIMVRPGAYVTALVRWRIGLEAGLEFVG
jgi:hypothetical protein